MLRRVGWIRSNWGHRGDRVAETDGVGPSRGVEAQAADHRRQIATWSTAVPCSASSSWPGVFSQFLVDL